MKESGTILPDIGIGANFLEGIGFGRVSTAQENGENKQNDKKMARKFHAGKT